MARGPVPAGRRIVGGVHGPGHRGPAGPRSIDGRPELGPDDPRTSCSPRGRPGCPRAWCMTHGRTLLVATDWVAMTGLSADDRYLMVNPYFHMFGLKAGILACVASGATMLPEAVFDVDRVLGRVDAERVTVLPGPPTLYQAILDHPDRGRARPLHPAGGGDRRGRHPGRAHPPHRRRAALLAHHHRLRAHRGGHGRGHLARGRRRDHRHHGRAAASRVRAPHRRRRRRDVPAGEPGEVLLRGGSVMSATSTIPRRPHRRSPPTAGCAPATSAWSTRPAACASSAGPRTCSSSAASTPIRPRSRTSSSATRASGRRR